MIDQHMVRFARTSLSLAVMALAMSAAHAQTTAPAAEDKDSATPRVQDDKVRLGTVVVVGSGNKLGSGLMVNDDSVKNRSIATKASLEKEPSTGNIYQSISMLPGVNTYNNDATGLFGGGLTIRGFNSDQIGFSVNGVPVNDSGNFAVYPQEFIDKENVCQATVAQGSTELETASGSASGGSVGIITCDPEDKRRVRFAQTLGDLNLTRTYVRLDSGRFMNDMAKLFISYSHTEADKWKGKGKAKKDHIDFGFSLDLSPDNKILGSVLYNRAVNNNILSNSMATAAANYYTDYDTPFVPHKTPGAGAQVDVAATTPNVFWGTSLNPFENVIASVSGSFKLAENTYLKVQPYMWYGFGNGGWSEVALKENGGLLGAATNGTRTLTAVDLNGDGDTLDTWKIARSSVTKTQRPGVTAEISTTIGSHYLKFGAWFERAQHRQTQPGVQFNADGTPADMWLQTGCVQRADGSCYEFRDQKTISTAHQAYVSDQFSFMDDRGMLYLGVRVPTLKRDVTNYANESGNASYTSATATTGGTTVYKDYQISRSYTKALPQIGVRFNLDASNQVYANVSKNFRAPPNIAFTGNNVRFVNGVITPWAEIQPETTTMTDVGYRFQSSMGSLSVTYFNSDFKNRQATAIDPNTQLSVYTNAGRVNNHGIELEAATKVYNGFSAYASVTAQKSEMKDDIVATKTVTLPTTGKQFATTPKYLAALAIQYEQGPLYVRAKGKYTGSQYASLMNDEAAPAYRVFDLEGGYKLGDFGMMKAAQVRVNVTNITNKRYLSPSSGILLNAKTYVTPTNVSYTSSGAFYYEGAPRMATITLSADFQ
ncbi:TonB-dependent receptor [Burkholderiaceae bacterium UC74_6]